jgi:hypothetical protein
MMRIGVADETFNDAGRVLTWRARFGPDLVPVLASFGPKHVPILARFSKKTARFLTFFDASIRRPRVAANLAVSFHFTYHTPREMKRVK